MSVQGELVEVTDNNDVIIGPWGSEGGFTTSWMFKPDGRIDQIHIASGDVVDSIKFSYTNEEGVTHDSEKYGGNGGSLQKINFARLEEIVGISGTFGKSSDNIVITSLTFQTNFETYGPYGKEEGTSFSLPVEKGTFVGFLGSYGDSLNAIGAILNP